MPATKSRSRAERREWTATTPEPGEDRKFIDYRLSAAYRSVDRSHQLLTSADNKALIALAFQGAILAGVASTSELTRQAVVRCLHSCQGYHVAYIIVAMFCCMTLSIQKALGVIYPNLPKQTAGKSDHLFYFLTIAGLTESEYLRSIRNLSPEDIEAELATHNHKLAVMVKSKFNRVQASVFWLRFQVGFAALAALALFLSPQ